MSKQKPQGLLMLGPRVISAASVGQVSGPASFRAGLDTRGRK